MTESSDRLAERAGGRRVARGAFQLVCYAVVVAGGIVGARFALWAVGGGPVAWPSDSGLALYRALFVVPPAAVILVLLVSAAGFAILGARGDGVAAHVVATGAVIVLVLVMLAAVWLQANWTSSEFPHYGP
jgi:hypothetical protein